MRFNCIDAIVESQVERFIGASVEDAVSVSGIEVGEFFGEVFAVAEENGVVAENAVEFDLAVVAHKDLRVLSEVVGIG